MKFILGTKQQMTQYFNEEGKVSPATLVYAGPVVVSQLKTDKIDGYNAVQVDYLNKYFKEVRVENKELESIKKGDKIDVSIFEKGDKVYVSGVSKGKGFQGVVKRHGFHGGSRSHGQKHSEREPGSIGATGPQRVFKGMRMAGRMGGDKITVKNLSIIEVDKKNNQLLIKGAIPGRRGTLLEIHGS